MDVPLKAEDVRKAWEFVCIQEGGKTVNWNGIKMLVGLLLPDFEPQEFFEQKPEFQVGDVVEVVGMENEPINLYATGTIGVINTINENVTAEIDWIKTNLPKNAWGSVPFIKNLKLLYRPGGEK